MRKAIISILLAFLAFQPALALAQTDYRFTGQELDGETSLYDYGARNYQPNTGRFIQQDSALKDGSLDINFLNNAKKDELNDFLSSPQNLNPYSYVNNNPIKYTDPTGNVEISAALFNPVNTARQIGFWLGIVNSRLRTSGRNTSASLLQHSLNLRIGNNLDLHVTQNNDQYNMISSIKESGDYKSFVQKQIKIAEGKGQNTINELFNNTNGRDSIVFNSGDLETSLHGTHSTYITGTKLDSGDWDINVNITDVYDFKPESYGEDAESKIGNNTAVISQSQGVISNYNININFSDRISY
jgi:RHS repeat-associated protein